MTKAQTKELAEAMASMLLSHAAHGLATGSLEGTGEIALRDGLIVAAAAQGARVRQAWIIDREVTPSGWIDAAVDVVIRRAKSHGTTSMIGGVELKWWRKTDAANSANRRFELVRDFLRAGALCALVDRFSFVALLSTSESWEATAATTGADSTVMGFLSATGKQPWHLRMLSSGSAIKRAVASLRDKVPITSSLHTELLCTRSLTDSSNPRPMAFVRIWRVTKPQKSKLLASNELDKLFPPKKQEAKAGQGTTAGKPGAQ